MAGARIEITKDTARPALQRAIAQMQGEGRELMLSDIGEYLLRSTRERAAKQVDPNGVPWQPLSKPYKKWKDKKRPGVPILKFDFHMLGDQLSYQVHDDVLLVGTNAPYGASHQFGATVHHAPRSTLVSFKKHGKGKRFASQKDADSESWHGVRGYDVTLPARPWLGLSDQDHVEVLAIASDHLAGMFEGD